MAIRGLVLLAVAAIASSASIGSQQCCGPAEWEAMAVASAAFGAMSSQTMSGRMSVDHDRKLAALYLMQQMNNGNMSMAINMNDSDVFIYFIIHQLRQPEPTPMCAAYVLKNVLSDLSDRCFTTGQSSQDSLPVDLLAYEYAGLAGLMAVKLYANRNDCSQKMMGMSTGSDDGPLLGILLSNVKSGVSDRSILDQAPTPCQQTKPLEIRMPSGGFNKRRGSVKSGQWIDDLVLMYIVNQMPRVDPRHRRDLTDILAMNSLDGQSSIVQTVENAIVMRQLLQHFSEFIGTVNNSNQTDNSSRSDIETLVQLMIMQNLISDARSNNDHDDSRQRDDRSDDDDELDTLVKLMVAKNLLHIRQPDQMSQMVSQILRMAAIRAIVQYNQPHVSPINQHDSTPDMSTLAKLMALQQQKSDSTPDMSTLMKLMLLQQTQDDGPDFSDLLKLMALQQNQGDNTPDMSTLMKLMLLQQTQDDGPDFSDLLKLMTLQQNQGDNTPDMSTLMKLMLLQQTQDDGPDFSDLLKLMALQQHQDDDQPDFSDLLKLMKHRDDEDSSPDMSDLLKLMKHRDDEDSSPDMSELWKLMKHRDNGDSSPDMLDLWKLMKHRDNGDSSPDMSDLLKLMKHRDNGDSSPDMSDLLKLMKHRDDEDSSPDMSDLLKLMAAQQHQDDKPDFSDLLKLLVSQKRH